MADDKIRITILLVDDEENILRSLQRLLIDEDFSIETATSGEAALEKLKTLENVGLIVSDQRMPGMNGAEFLGRSREYVPDAVRILLTGYSDINATIDAINKGGASRYLSKPWNDEELIQVIRDAVRHYALVAENKRLNGIIAQQNEELQEWNNNLKGRVLQQTTAIRMKSEEVQSALELSRISFNGIIETLSTLVELRGKRTHQHSRNVAQMAVDAAKELGIKGAELENIRIASLLHDIGEIGIPEKILLMAPEVMDRDEFQEYCLHPVRGQLLLDHIIELRPAALLIRHHHENYDGTGFPDRISGDDIPLGSRLLAFADQIDTAAMGLKKDVADRSLARATLSLGKCLDPSLLLLFKNCVRNCYGSRTKQKPEVTTVLMELRPKELQPGMVLADDLFSGTGLLLLQKGITFNVMQIAALKRYYTIDPSKTGVFVLVKV
jgi:response regulator RpfG family c-di-GMP phosphodiesterase